MCPLRVFLFLGSVGIILVSLWAVVADEKGVEVLKPRDQTWWRWFVSLWTGEFLYAKAWPQAQADPACTAEEGCRQPDVTIAPVDGEPAAVMAGGG